MIGHSARYHSAVNIFIHLAGIKHIPIAHVNPYTFSATNLNVPLTAIAGSIHKYSVGEIDKEGGSLIM
jgi:hypothetical protein